MFSVNRVINDVLYRFEFDDKYNPIGRIIEDTFLLDPEEFSNDDMKVYRYRFEMLSLLYEFIIKSNELMDSIGINRKFVIVLPEDGDMYRVILNIGDVRSMSLKQLNNFSMMYNVTYAYKIRDNKLIFQLFQED